MSIFVSKGMRPALTTRRGGGGFASSLPIVGGGGGGGNPDSDDFDGANGSALDAGRWSTFNAGSTGGVTQQDGRYQNLIDDDGGSGNTSLWFGSSQGRYDYQDPGSLSFEYVAHNCGIGQVGDPTTAPAFVSNRFKLCGILVHADGDDPGPDVFTSQSYRGYFVGHRGSTQFTIEAKNNNAGTSNVTDEGADAAPLGRADLRVVGNGDGTINFFYRQPGEGEGDWVAAVVPGFQNPEPFTLANIRVGLVAYKYTEFAANFVGVCDRWERRS